MTSHAPEPASSHQHSRTGARAVTEPPTTEAARQAAGYLRETAPRNRVEQAAIRELDSRRWILWHSNDRDVCVVLLLSRLGLLRDLEDEKRRQAREASEAAYAERSRTADRTAITRLSDLATEAADRLEAGEPPVEVAAGLRRARDVLLRQWEEARKP